MLLYVMRHGPAQDRAASGYDADRALTPEGRELVARAARELGRRSGAGIVRVLASPLVRARETAELVRAVVCPHGVVELRRELLPDDDPPLSLVQEVVALGGDSLVVGHQPSVEALVRALAEDGARTALGVGFRTAMIVSLQAAAYAAAGAPRFRVRMVLDPRDAGGGHGQGQGQGQGR
jgi:phosphohistidine phosphatase